MAVTLSISTNSGVDLSRATLYDEFANRPIDPMPSSTFYTTTDTGVFNGNLHGGMRFFAFGSGLTYNGSYPNIQLTGGTITEVQVRDSGGNLLVDYSGFTISAVAFASAVTSYVFSGGTNTSALDAILKSYQYIQDSAQTGGGGVDTIEGGDLNDTRLGFGNGDTLIGNAGSDFFSGGSGNDTINGGTGIDLASYSGAGAGITATLGVTSSVTGDASVGTDTLTSVEEIRG